MLDDIDEQDPSFLECKHKHMMISIAPLDNVGSPVPSVTYRIPWFHKQNWFLSHLTSQI